MEVARRHILFLSAYIVHRHHRGIVRYAKEAGWILDASMAYSGRMPESRHCDGIISFHSDRADIMQRIHEAGVPTVDLSLGDGIPGLPCVRHNNLEIGRQAARHLLERGYREIAYAGWFRYANDLGREAGLREVVEREGGRFTRIRVEELEARARELTKPAAIMFQNDMHAADGELRLLDAGFDVPHEIAVMGCDNDDLYFDTAPVPLSSVDSEVERCGYEAARLLDRLMSGEAPPKAPVLVPPSGVHERDSTRLIAIPHAPTSRALAAIRARFLEPLDLDEIARVSGLGRRRLEDHFKAHVGRTMAEELRRLRIDEADRRIATSDDKLADIAVSCGFSDGAHLTHAFRAAFGETPEARRKRVRK